MKWFPIFRTGKHTDSQGREREWTEGDLDKIIEMNNGTEAPLVIGHPEVNSPAYGWANAFKREGQMLYAKPKQLVSEFADWVKKGLWKKISISIRPDFTLRHIGFLGATPPSVQGLPAVEFNTEADAMTFEFSDWKEMRIASIFQRLRDFIIEKFGLDTADGIITSYDIDDIKAPNPEDMQSSFADMSPEKKAQQARSTKYGIGIKDGGNVTKPSKYTDIPDEEFADPVNYRYPINADHCQAALSYWGMPKNREQYTAEEVKTITNRILKAAKKHGLEIDESKWNFNEGGSDMEKVQELELKLKEREKEIADFSEKDKTKDTEMVNLKKDLADERAKNRKAEFAAFCDSDEMKEKITPAIKPMVLDFMEILSVAQEFEFAEAEGKKVKAQPLERFKAFLTGLPKAVDFSEVATKKKATDKGAGSDFETKVSEFAETNKTTRGTAISAMAKEFPDLHAEWLEGQNKK